MKAIVMAAALLAGCSGRGEIPVDETTHLELGEERIISISEEDDPEWGFHQFPDIARLPTGEIAVFFQVAEDSSDSYGKNGFRVFISNDDGETWEESDQGEITKFRRHAVLDNGQILSLRVDKPYPLEDLDLPEPAGHMTLSYDYTRNPTALYKFSELPDQMRTLPLNRYKNGKWHDESPELDNPEDLRPTYTKHFPMIFFGDVRKLHDGSLITAVYPNYTQMSIKGSACFYKSHDKGKSWEVAGRILYQPDLAADPHGVMRGGFTELSVIEASPNHLICALRTTDASPGVAPLYLAHSEDGGATWSKPSVVADHGVEPRLAKTEDGALILSYGRPAVSAKVSQDEGRTWSAPRWIVPHTYHHPRDDSCGYSGLLPMDGETCMIVYSRFNYEGKKKAIGVRTITAKKLSESEQLFAAIDLPPEEEEMIEHDLNGHLYQQFPLKTGVGRTYYPDGTLASQTPFVDGKTHGRQKYYHPNGQLFKEISWVDGEVHGGIREYTPAGVCTGEGVRIKWEEATHEDWWSQ